MLSYRHGFHAGCHGDVLKHWVTVLISEYMGQKDKPYTYVDTHAATGAYELNSELANKTAEYKGGIAKLWKQDAPQIFHSYLKLVKTFNPSGELALYPGSPWFARQSFRNKDMAHLYELHPQDFQHLKRNFARDKQIKLAMTDGFAALKAVLPPPSKRAFVAIDPPYEQAKEYDEVVSNLTDAIKRFATGVYLVWYPLLDRKSKQTASEAMVEKLKQLKIKSYLDVRLWVGGERDELGMYGSGLFIINPPWQLKAQLEEGLPYLKKMLAVNDGAGFSVQAEELS